MKSIPLIAVLLAGSVLQPVKGQLFYTKNGKISFFSRTPVENIAADNNQVLSVLNLQAGTIQFSALNDAFYFPKARMQEDFEESYMETARYPKSVFKGTIAGADSVELGRDGNYPVTVTGDLTIHGITRRVTVPGQLTVDKGILSAKATFQVFIRDFHIEIPSIISEKIAQSIEITVSCNYIKN